jgi:hypothetical protein
MLQRFTPLLLGLTFFVAILAGIALGRRQSHKQQLRDPEGYRAGAGTIEAAVFALLGLVLAFTFSGAASRFDERRDLVVQEANIIGTAYLRLDVLPADSQPALRESFRRYLDSRIATYAGIPRGIDPRPELEHSLELQQTIWSQAVRATRAASSPAVTTVVLPAINELIDIVTTRTMATKKHPPLIIFFLLCGVAMIGAFFAGHGMTSGTSRHLTHSVGFAIAVAITIYVILELEFPRLGLIRVDAYDEVLVALRASWG